MYMGRGAYRLEGALAKPPLHRTPAEGALWVLAQGRFIPLSFGILATSLRAPISAGRTPMPGTDRSESQWIPSARYLFLPTSTRSRASAMTRCPSGVG